MFRSDYFAEADVFYSYETCNSTYVWAGSDNALGGISIKAAIPDYSLPMIYKMSGVEMLDTPPGEEFYNNRWVCIALFLLFVSLFIV